MQAILIYFLHLMIWFHKIVAEVSTHHLDVSIKVSRGRLDEMRGQLSVRNETLLDF
jgi:hypothetical protein